MLYLSRTREYLADAFSVGRVEPKHLAGALVKIAYGIVAIEDTEATQSLLRSTLQLGVVDVKNARYTGLLAESTATHPGAAAEAMLFDAYNPWAALPTHDRLPQNLPARSRREALVLAAWLVAMGPLSATRPAMPATSRPAPSLRLSMARPCD